MPEITDPLAAFGVLVSRPAPGFADALAEITSSKAWPIDVARPIAEFAERIRELSMDELQELHDETFSRDASPGAGSGRHGAQRWPISPETVREDWKGLTTWLHRADPAAAGRESTPAGVLDLIVRLQRTLVAARNPYHHVLAAFHAFLLGRPATR